ncbi:helix-turn-helix domain-containing protein [Buttiauxella warmboldiae]|uniref:Helix-turn-helix domain-containing protein n=1 Tax=Buttiauxella warmboldiae TaxID=82993 RepID=A0A3N5EF33_9ENTR|nr:helix-turn-helix domain-containing protein [Buttiauxella warmboldiae]RPH29782.1 helix-turn-helix domain-containing protein [Buttiauxella warmboldiae]
MSLSSSIPVFKLYGESRNWPASDLLHCESIHSRSSLHEWHIRTHQHADLVQLLYLHKGQVEIDIEGVNHPVEHACIQIVPALCVHGFQFSPGAQGYSLSLSAPLITQFEQQFGRPLQVLTQAACIPVKNSHRQIKTLFKALQSEYQGQGEARDMMLHSLIGTLLVWLNRQCAPVPGGGSHGERKRAVVQRFNRLVEQHYREQLPVTYYARAVGVSSVSLNNLCHEFYGESALNVLHQRVLLEAKRSLLYTSMTISQISDYLGFSDATYFSRFFRRYTATTAKDFRQQPLRDL